MRPGIVNGAGREGISEAVPAGEELKWAVSIGKDRIGYIVGRIHPDVQPPSLPVIFNAGGDIRFGVEALTIRCHNPQTEFHFGKTMIRCAHGFAKSRRHGVACEGPAQEPAQHTGGHRLPGAQEEKIGGAFKGLANRGKLHPPCRHPGTGHRAMQRLTRDMVPVGPRLIIDEQYQPIVQAAGAEMMPSSIDQGRQTDAAVADHSKRDQEGIMRQDTLGRMMIRHLAHQQGAFFPGPFKDNKLFVPGDTGLGEFGAGIGYGESSKEVGAFQQGPPGIKHHGWFSMAVWMVFSLIPVQ